MSVMHGELAYICRTSEEYEFVKKYKCNMKSRLYNVDLDELLENHEAPLIFYDYGGFDEYRLYLTATNYELKRKNTTVIEAATLLRKRKLLKLNSTSDLV